MVPRVHIQTQGLRMLAGLLKDLSRQNLSATDSFPPPDSPQSGRSSSEITFAVLYDDGPDYTIGHFSDNGSIHSGRPSSMMSNAPSYRSRQSVDMHASNWPLSQDHQAANAALGLNLSARDAMRSEETLALNTLQTTRDSKHDAAPMRLSGVPSRLSAAPTYCTCHEDMERSNRTSMKKDHDYHSLRHSDIENQTPTVPTFPVEDTRDRNLVSSTNL